jgi:hypothetical protein
VILVPVERLVFVGARYTSTPAWAVVVLVLSEADVLVCSNGVETDEDALVAEPEPLVEVVVEPVGSVSVAPDPGIAEVVPPPPMPPIIPWPLSVPEGLNGNKGAGLMEDTGGLEVLALAFVPLLAVVELLGLSTNE